MLWTTRSGEQIKIVDMSDAHLRNTHKMLERDGHGGPCIGTDMVSDPCMECFLWETDPTRLAVVSEVVKRGLTI